MKVIFLSTFLFAVGAQARVGSSPQDELIQRHLEAMQAKVESLLNKIESLENSIADNDRVIVALEEDRRLTLSCSLAAVTEIDSNGKNITKCRHNGNLNIDGDAYITGGNLYISGGVRRNRKLAGGVDCSINANLGDPGCALGGAGSHGGGGGGHGKNNGDQRALPIFPDFSTSSLIVDSNVEVSRDLIVGNSLFVLGDTDLYKKLSVQGGGNLGILRVVHDFYCATNTTIGHQAQQQKANPRNNPGHGYVNTLTIQGNAHVKGKTLIEGYTTIAGDVEVTNGAHGVGKNNGKVYVYGDLKLTGGTIYFEDDADFQGALTVDKMTVKKSCSIVNATTGIYSSCP